jgi:hypothetical protein
VGVLPGAGEGTGVVEGRIPKFEVRHSKLDDGILDGGAPVFLEAWRGMARTNWQRLGLKCAKNFCGKCGWGIMLGVS